MSRLTNMVAFRAKVDRTWQPKFQRRLRCRATSLRPSGLPNLPFSLVLTFSSFVLHFTPCFPFFLLFFHLVTLFPSPFSFSFFPHFPIFFFTFSHFQLFPTFPGQSDGSLCNSLANFVPREAPPTSERDTLWEKIFAHFSAFLGTFKKGP